MRGRRIAWSDEELAFVKAHAHLSREDILKGLQDRFDRFDLTCENVKALCTRKKWSAGAAGRSRNKGKITCFTPEQVAWLTRNAALSLSDAVEAFRRDFPNDSVSRTRISGFRKRMGLKTGRTGRFEPGSTSWNKGKQIGSHPNSAKTQFKKGQVPFNLLPLGAERITEDGYVLVKVAETNPHTGAATRFVHKHRWQWEKANGPVPEGHVLKCLDGNRQNCDPKNWDAVPTGLLPRLNGKSGRDYDRSPSELQPTIMAIARLEHAIRNQTS